MGLAPKFMKDITTRKDVPGPGKYNSDISTLSKKRYRFFYIGLQDLKEFSYQIRIELQVPAHIKFQ